MQTEDPRKTLFQKQIWGRLKAAGVCRDSSAQSYERAKAVMGLKDQWGRYSPDEADAILAAIRAYVRF